MPDEGDGQDARSPLSDRAPDSRSGSLDLRHLRYVALSPAPPDGAPTDIPLRTRLLRAALLGAFAGGSLTMQVTGHAFAGLAVGGALGLASVLGPRLRRPSDRGRSFVLVPWGVLLDGELDIAAIRWSGVHSVDVRYRAGRDGSVHARVAVDSVAGALVGFASDAVDLGALPAELEGVAVASARPLAIDLSGERSTIDGEPFAERLLDAARTLVTTGGDARVPLGLEPRSYREGGACPPSSRSEVARTLRAIAAAPRGTADVSALVAAVAGELRLAAFGRDLSLLSNNPHPGIAAIARAALGRLPRGAHEEAPRDLEAEEAEALSWFVPQEELALLRAWRDAPA